MLERFEEVFDEVMDEMGKSWWELFDSENFEIVEARIAEEFGKDVLESEEYLDWVAEMAEDL